MWDQAELVAGAQRDVCGTAGQVSMTALAWESRMKGSSLPSCKGDRWPPGPLLETSALLEEEVREGKGANITLFSCWVLIQEKVPTATEGAAVETPLFPHGVCLRGALPWVHFLKVQQQTGYGRQQQNSGIRCSALVCACVCVCFCVRVCTYMGVCVCVHA